MALERNAAWLRRSRLLPFQRQQWAEMFCATPACTRADVPEGVWRGRAPQPDNEDTRTSIMPSVSPHDARPITLGAQWTPRARFVLGVLGSAGALRLQVVAAAVFAAAASYHITLLLCESAAPPLTAAADRLRAQSASAPARRDAPRTASVSDAAAMLPPRADDTLLQAERGDASDRPTHEVAESRARESRRSVKPHEGPRQQTNPEAHSLPSALAKPLHVEGEADPTSEPPPPQQGAAPSVLEAAPLGISAIATSGPDPAEETSRVVDPPADPTTAAPTSPPALASRSAGAEAVRADTALTLELSAVRGALTRRRVKRGCARIEPELAQCLRSDRAKALASDASSNAWTLRAAIDPHGRAHQVEVEGYTDDSTKRCLERAIRHLQVEVPDTGGAVIEWRALASARLGGSEHRL